MSSTRRSRHYLLRWAGLVGACVVMAAALGWVISWQVNEVVLAEVLARAKDQVDLGVLPRVTAADFEPPFTAAKLDNLGARLASVLDRARQHSSGVIRVNVYARDGTVLYSDLASLRGLVVSPLADELLSEALAGSARAGITSLTGPEDRDLGPRYGSAFEAYVPLGLDGRVVGVYEFYTDLALIRPIRLVVWGSTAAAFGLLLLGVLVVERGRGRLARTPPLIQAAPRSAVPIALAMGAVRLIPAASQAGAITAPDDRPDAPTAALMPSAGKPATECWLTRREMEILRLLATDRTYRQIADDLFLSEETVRSHVKHILRKLREPDRSHAVASAVRAGILSS